MTGRRDPLLLLAVLCALVLALVDAFLPPFRGRMPVAVVGGVWAPGYALVALAWPRGRLVGLERHALAVAAGFLALPLVGLLAGETVGLSRAPWLVLAVTGACAAAAWRGSGGAEAAARSPVPSTRVTLGVSGAALLASGLLLVPALAQDPVPASLAMGNADGGPFPLRLRVGDDARVLVEARAGTEPAAGDLVVRWNGQVLLQERMALAAGAGARVTVPLPTDAPGVHAFTATWAGRETHAQVDVEGAA